MKIARWVSSLVVAVVLGLVALAGPAAAAPEGQIVWGVHFSLAPTWLDPADTPAMITPFLTLYALHDAVAKPMPGNPMAPNLAESWTVSKDGLAYEFVLRKNVRFHNGDVLHADDVKFSFERYKGASASLLKQRVAGVDVVDPLRVRFRLKEPWPDFLTFYATPATGAGWVVPKKYVEKVGDEGFLKAPVGAGPYKFVSFNPGVELVLEAFEGYWRKVPSVKRLVFKVSPDESTRLAMLKRGEADIVYSIRGPLAEELRRTPGLSLKPAVIQGTFWLAFVDQWDPKSPWHDRRVRLAANHAIDRNAINQAETLGFSKVTGSIIPSSFEFYKPLPLSAMIRRRRASSWPSPAIPTASMPASSPATRPIRTSRRPSSTISRWWASACTSGRSSGPRSSPSTARRSSRTSSRPRAAPSAAPRPGSSRSW